MADKKSKKRLKSSYYIIEGSSIRKNRKNCPKCGAGVFMAEHKDRYSCGSCGYMEVKK